ncbi:MAG: PAS domain-containing protein [Deltaproteobacteria bacterium]|nr:PAS domain-containing protein [Deltaproteobacteria bacterium]
MSDVASGSTSEDERLDSKILDAILDSKESLIAWLDSDLHFRRVSRGYASACGGRAPEWFVGRGHFELFPHRENEAIFRRVLETGISASHASKAFEHPDQLDRHTTYWDWTLEPVSASKERVCGLVFTLKEVTGQRRSPSP